MIQLSSVTVATLIAWLSPAQETLEPHSIPLYGEDELFGLQVALEGTTAVVGSPGDFTFSSGDGSVYVYTFGGTGWSQTAELVGEGIDGPLGKALDLAGDELFVGGGTGSGFVQLFERQQGVWQETAYLEASSGHFFDYFGNALSRDGDRLAVAAPSDDEAGNSAGAVYIFEKIGNVWTEVEKLTGDGDLAHFGRALALEGDTLAVRDYQENRVSMYERQPSGDWVLDQLVFDAQRVGQDDEFGTQILLQGDELVVLAPDYSLPPSDSGLVYVFARSGGVWGETQRLQGPMGVPFDRGITRDGGRLLISSSAEEVHSYAQQGSTWQFEGSFNSSMGRYGALDLDGDRVLGGDGVADVFGPDSGGAWVFEWTGTDWGPGVGLLPAAGDSSDFGFGSRLALDGDRLAAAAFAAGTGRTYTYERQGTDWSPSGIVIPTPEQPDDIIGIGALEMIGDVLLVGAPGLDWTPGSDNTGGVFAYRWGGSAWSLDQPVLRNFSQDVQSSADAGFGSAIAAEGNWLVIGAPRQQKVGGIRTGFAFVFHRLQPTGPYLYREHLGPMDSFGGMRYGGAVGISGTTVAVCSEPADRIDVYEKQGSAWVEIQRILAPGTGLGRSVDMQGDTMVVGTDGSVRVYERSGPSQPYGLVDEVTPSDGQAAEDFGWSVSLDGDLMVVGSPLWASNFTDPGFAYVFRNTGGEWIQTGRYHLPSAGDPDRLGYQAVVSGTTVAVGAHQKDSAAGVEDEGLVIVDELLEDRFSFCDCEADAPCGNESIGSGCANSTGLGASIGASGSTSVTTDDLVVSVVDLPPNKFGMIFRGSRPRVPVTFGDGLRCVFGQTRRGPVRNSGPGGTIAIGPGYVAAENGVVSPALMILVGQTWYFQGYYRDAGGPCGTLFSSSNALGVVYGP